MRRWFEVAVGGLGWRPQEFWDATVDEYLMAYEGHKVANSPIVPMGSEEFLGWLEDYPDGGSITRRKRDKGKAKKRGR